jgi:hypothetical protein
MIDSAEDRFDPVQYLTAVYLDETQPVELRIQASVALLPYSCASLAPIDPLDADELVDPSEPLPGLQ